MPAQSIPFNCYSGCINQTIAIKICAGDDRRTGLSEAAFIQNAVRYEQFPDLFEKPKDYYLIVSAFAPYKRIDLAVDAFRRMGKRLVVIGGGQDKKKLLKLANGAPTIEFLQGISTEGLGEFYRKAKAFVFPGLEDFGITPLESMYNGRPVIAYGKGGLLDTVTEETGVFFPEQSVESLIAAVEKFEREEARFDPARIRERAMGFTRAHFLRDFTRELERALSVRG